MILFAFGVVVGVVISWIVAVECVASLRRPCGVCGDGGRFDGRDLCARHVPRLGHNPPPAKPGRLPVLPLAVPPPPGPRAANWYPSPVRDPPPSSPPPPAPPRRGSS